MSGGSKGPVAGWAALAALVVLTVGGSAGSALAQQQTLSDKARLSIEEAGLSVEIRFDGRDATVSGTDPGDVEEAARLVLAIDGTRRVEKITSTDDRDLSPKDGTPTPSHKPLPTSSPTESVVGPTISSTPTPAASTTSASPTPTPTSTEPMPDLDVRFLGQSAAATGAESAKLDRIAAWMKRNPSARIAVQGHTDNGLSLSERTALSKKRAEWVAAGLVARGVSRDRLAVRALGGTRPKASNETKEGRAQNRRVDFVVTRR
jgi:outer membrane protein OmpA-like peptidoglycan-associated protein